MRGTSSIQFALWMTCVVGIGLVARPHAQAQTARKPTMRVTLGAGHAKIVVRRAWTMDHGSGILMRAFSIPRTSVLTDFRVLRARGWQRTQLLAAADAEKLFFGKGAAGGMATLLTAAGRENESMTLKLSPVGTSKERTIEYTLLMPTSYSNGRHVLENLGVGSTDENLIPEVTKLMAASAGHVLVDDHRATQKKPLDLVGGHELQFKPRTRKRLDGAVAFVHLGRDRRVLRYRIHAAEKLGQFPAKAHVVLVLDASRSMSVEQGNGIVAAARAYVAHMPDAKVDVVTFDRDATSLFGKFLPANRALGVLSSLSLTRNNGSNVKRALALAATRLATLPNRANKRVVLFTDALTKASLDPKDLGLDKVGGLLHVAVIGGSSSALRRLDTHAWAPFVETTGGVLWKTTPSAGTSFATLKATYEELARPVRMHRVAVSIPAAPSLQAQVRTTLVEGSGISGLALAADLDPRVRLTGVLWSKPVSITIDPSFRETKVWNAMLLGSRLARKLTDDEERRLAMKAGVVTKQTSFVFATKGKRTINFGIGGIGMFNSGGVGCRMGFAQSTSKLARPTAWFRKSLEAAYSRCQGADRAVKMTLEMTKSEIVDVRAETADAKLRSCMQRAAWSLTVPTGLGVNHPNKFFVVALPLAEPKFPPPSAK